MKYITAAAVLVTIASAQSISDIPQCAIPCIDDARTTSTNCAADDYPCICKPRIFDFSFLLLCIRFR
ncbi:hypothetical protein F4818DRAFT_419995 [Hypoxylon cercidicola]|nr:hypothetical protein F4818DRAFT_419995 [Hypoxylon cercidicola]